MSDFDVIVLGAGSAGKAIANDLATGGCSVGLVESQRVGGECPYVACIPSKSMLRSAEVRSLVRHAVELGATASPLGLDDDADAFAAAAARRDELSHDRDDTETAQDVVEHGVTLLRGRGAILGPSAVDVDGVHHGCSHLVIATGSSPNRPDVDGLDDEHVWTSDQALSSSHRPHSLLILGGGPVGCELAQVYARFGSAVTIVENAKRLVSSEEPAVGDALADVLRRDGVDVRTNTSARSARRTDRGVALTFDDGGIVDVEQVIAASGRSPNLHGIGLESLGIELDDAGIPTDDTGRVAGHTQVWAAGDVTGIAPFTHTANYQARLVTANIRGASRVGDYRAVPRVVYTDPPLAAVGLTTAEARDAHIAVRTATANIDATARSATDGARDGCLILIADSARSVLIGAGAVGAHADEWLAQMTLAIRAEVPLAVLGDVIHAFPTFGEILGRTLRGLATPPE